MFNEAQLENAFIDLLDTEGIKHLKGAEINRTNDEVLITEDLKNYLHLQYVDLSDAEIESIIRKLEVLPSSDLYYSNKQIMDWISNGFVFKRDDHSKKDIFIRLINFSEKDNNTYRFVNQLRIVQHHPEGRIPDGIIYINGIPLVVFEFKTAINENVRLWDAWHQITNRYHRDIPELFKYNAFCVISDGVNTKAGSFFASYEFYYAWRKITGNETKESEGIDSAFSLIHGMCNKKHLREVIHHFIYMPDTGNKDIKILCRYPQFYAANKLFENIKLHQRPDGDGKGGTYFGATGCGKSFTMLFLTRLLMRSTYFKSPTIILITDRTDLDSQLSKEFTNAKNYIGDSNIISVESRSHLRELLRGRPSGGVFLSTIHKFNEDIELLTDRNNVICISDEAHRSQINLDQKVKITDKGIEKTFGFAKYLHDSLPNAIYVGFTGTPIDATLDVFGDIVDSYTMTESVRDEITVRIVYEGRAAKVVLDNSKLAEIEQYYDLCAVEGSSDYQVEESKKAMGNMDAILGDPDVVNSIAEDFVKHYTKRVEEGSSVKGKAMFVCPSRSIAYVLYKQILTLKPEWGEVLIAESEDDLSDHEQKKNKPMQRVKMIMTRDKDDPKKMYDLLGNKDYRKELDKEFKNGKSNFKIAIVVDMWLTGFDVPFLDTIYIYKPLQKHNLIQTISRVNRKFKGKNKGLVVDYIGIKKAMNLALAMYNKADSQNFEDISQSIVVVKDHLDILGKIFYRFDNKDYFTGSPLSQLQSLNKSAEHVQSTLEIEKRFMHLVKRLKAAYDICAGSEAFDGKQRDYIHYYLAIRAIVFKLTKGNTPDSSQMNAKVREMIKDALQSDGVHEIFKLGDTNESQIDIFDDDYLAKINKIKLPNTKIKLLQQLLLKAISDIKKINKMQGVDFTKQLQGLVEKYNERKDSDILNSEVYEDMAESLTNLVLEIKKAFVAGDELGIDFEEKAFYDILKELAHKYDFDYPEDKLIVLATLVKGIVDDKAQYTDWNDRDDIKAELKVDLIILLGENGYPPVDRYEVYKEIFEQAENFKKNSMAMQAN